MGTSSFAVSQDGPHIAIVTLSRPEAGNRLTANHRLWAARDSERGNPTSKSS